MIDPLAPFSPPVLAGPEIYASRHLVLARSADPIAADVMEHLSVELAAALTATRVQAGGRAARLAALAGRVALVRLGQPGRPAGDPAITWLDWSRQPVDWQPSRGLTEPLNSLRIGGTREDQERDQAIVVRPHTLTVHYLLPLSANPAGIAESLDVMLEAAGLVAREAMLGRIYRVGWLLPHAALPLTLPGRWAVPGAADLVAGRARLFREGWYACRAGLVADSARKLTLKQAEDRLRDLAHIWLLLREENAQGTLVPRQGDGLARYGAAALLTLLSSSLYPPDPDLARRLFLVDGTRWRSLEERIVPLSLRRLTHPYGTLRTRMQNRLRARLVHDGLLGTTTRSADLGGSQPWEIRSGEGSPADRLSYAARGDLRARIRDGIDTALEDAVAHLRTRLQTLTEVRSSGAAASAIPRRQQGRRREAPATVQPLAAEDRAFAGRLAELTEVARQALTACRPDVIMRQPETSRAANMAQAAADLRRIVEGALDEEAARRIETVAQVSSIRDAVQLAVQQERRQLQETLLDQVNAWLADYGGVAGMIGRVYGDLVAGWADIGGRVMVPRDQRVAILLGPTARPDQTASPARARLVPAVEAVRREVEGRRPYRPALVLWTLVLVIFLAEQGLVFPLSLPSGLVRAWHIALLLNVGWGDWLGALLGGVLGLLASLHYWLHARWRAMRRQAEAIAEFGAAATAYWQEAVEMLAARQIDRQFLELVRLLGQQIESWRQTLAQERLPAEFPAMPPPAGGWDLELTQPNGPLSQFADYPDDGEVAACLLELQQSVRTTMLETTGKPWLIKVGEGADWETSLRRMRSALGELVDKRVIAHLKPIETLQDVPDPPTPADILDRLTAGALPPRVPGRPPPTALLLVPRPGSGLAAEGETRGMEVIMTADPDHIGLLYLQQYALRPPLRVV